MRCQKPHAWMELAKTLQVVVLRLHTGLSYNMGGKAVVSGLLPCTFCYDSPGVVGLLVHGMGFWNQVGWISGLAKQGFGFWLTRMDGWMVITFTSSL